MSIKKIDTDPFYNIQQGINFLEKLIVKRLSHEYSKKNKPFQFSEKDMPKFKNDGFPFWKFIQENDLNIEELVVLLLGLVPHLDPSFLGNLINKHLPESGNFPELGGIKGEKHRYFLPTGETIMFLLANNSLTHRARLQSLFSNNHFFQKKGILYLEKVKLGDPKTSGKIILDEEYVELFISGQNALPKLSMDFPATHLSTEQDWDDLILPQKTIHQIKEIKDWIENQDTLMNDWAMAKKLKPGFRALFHGPPGTGKTLTATLLGKFTQLDVFRIDLSMVVSKYIGETEKNLATLFNKAENKNWILFFDEADALFGKRTNVRDAHDKYANQEVSYLLQRIENYPGLVILASNFKSNIDNAFTRRFNAIIHFPMPDALERLEIWKKGFPQNIKFGKNVDLERLAKSYELSGSNIMNVIQFACLRALANGKKIILEAYILKGIQKEFEKEGKLF